MGIYWINYRFTYRCTPQDAVIEGYIEHLFDLLLKLFGTDAQFTPHTARQGTRAHHKRGRDRTTKGRKAGHLDRQEDPGGGLLGSMTGPGYPLEFRKLKKGSVYSWALLPEGGNNVDTDSICRHSEHHLLVYHFQ